MNLKFSIFLITSHQFKRGELILGNIEESSEDGTLPDRKTTFSKIKFRPDSADNHATYACEVRIVFSLLRSQLFIPIQASHPALQGSLKGSRAGSPMRASVLLSVQCEYSDKLAEMIYSPTPHHTTHHKVWNKIYKAGLRGLQNGKEFLLLWLPSFLQLYYLSPLFKKTKKIVTHHKVWNKI